VALGIALLGVVIAALSAAPVAAQDSYTGVDVVFVVDQSGSMGGEKFGGEEGSVGTDPNGLRFLGSQQLIERLGGYRANYYHDSPVTFQVAVLYFGRSVAQIVPPTTISANSAQEWAPISLQLQPKLQVSAFYKSLGTTDHIGALAEAKRTLDAMKQSWPTGEKHFPVIFLITDGESYINCATDPKSPYCIGGQFQYSKYSEDLKAYRWKELPEPPYQLYMAFVNVDDNTWNKKEQYYKELTNNKVDRLDTDTMWAFFEKTLGDITVNNPDLPPVVPGKVTEIAETEDTVKVPPYLQEISFIIHKPKPEDRVSFTQNGQPVENVYAIQVDGGDQYIERITILKPAPGYITIKRPVTTGKLRIFMVQFGAEFKCVIPSVAQHVPTCLRCEILDKDNKPFPPYSSGQFGLRVEAEVTAAGYSQKLTLVTQGQSIWQTDLVLPEPGQHTYVVTAKTQDIEGQEIVPFSAPSYGMGQFTATAAEPRLVGAEGATALQPVDLHIEFADAMGSALSAAGCGNQYTAMIATFQPASGDAISVQLAEENGAYAGSFTPWSAGDYRVSVRAEVKDPTTGSASAAFDKEVGALTVRAPQVIWDGQGDTWPQYQPGMIGFYLADQSGQPLTIDPTANLQAGAQIRDAGGGAELVNLVDQGQGRWEGVWIPRNIGKYTVVVTLNVSGPNAPQAKLISSLTVHSFTVKPLTPRVADPTGITALQTTPLKIVFADANGQVVPVDSGASQYVRTKAIVSPEGISGEETEIPLAHDGDGYAGTFVPLRAQRYRVRLQGVVHDPASGASSMPIDQDIGALDVLPPKVIWDGSRDAWPQYEASRVAFHLADQSGSALQVEGATNLRADVQLRGPVGAAAAPVNQLATGTWEGQAVPDESGLHELRVSISHKAADGSDIVLINDLVLHQFNVEAVTLVRMVVEDPESEGSRAWRDLFWRVRPLDVQVALVDKQGNPVDPTKILKDPSAMPVEVSLVPPEGGAGEPLALVHGATGRFTATFSDYDEKKWYAHRDLGYYEIRMAPKAELKDTYTYGTEELVSSRAHLTRHPFWWVLPAIAALVAIALLILLGRSTYLHLWPAIGTVRVGNKWSYHLRDAGKHTITLDKRHGVPPAVRQIKVQQKLLSGPLAKAPRIILSVQHPNGVWVPRNVSVPNPYNTVVGNTCVTWSAGSEKPPTGVAPDLWAYVFGILGVGALAALIMVIVAIVSSLG